MEIVKLHRYSVEGRWVGWNKHRGTVGLLIRDCWLKISSKISTGLVRMLSALLQRESNGGVSVFFKICWCVRLGLRLIPKGPKSHNGFLGNLGRLSR
jgi:hypothetical protein